MTVNGNCDGEAIEAGRPSDREIEEALDRVYAWSEVRGFRGYNKHDGLNSPILRALLGWGRWPRLVAIQGVMRFPVNLRPLLLAKKTYNSKGLALFAQSLLDRYAVSGIERFRTEAERFLYLLADLRSPGNWSGDCWGYCYPWQDAGFFAPENTPNAVVTSFVCEAFIDAFRTTGERRFLDTVGSAISFLLKDLPALKENDEELCLGYVPLPVGMRVMDVSILIASVVAGYIELSRDHRHGCIAERLVRYVVQNQTDYGAWYYTDPPADSHIQHDNYHTGFILDALWRYMSATGDRRWETAYWKGLEFYSAELFNRDGSPRWMSNRDYPHDVHGAAQGILTFSRHRDLYPDLADRILQWTLDALYRPEGRFCYRQTRYYKRSFTLLRWCNAWMARAMASYLRHIA